MQAHFVTFLSPGTFVSETTSQPIDSWDVDAAVATSQKIRERHGATPYGFYFTTRSRGDADLDSKQTARSGTYYLGGIVRTFAEVDAEGNPSNETLLENMRINGWNTVITVRAFTAPFDERTDTLLEPKASRSAMHAELAGVLSAIIKNGSWEFDIIGNIDPYDCDEHKHAVAVLAKYNEAK